MRRLGQLAVNVRAVDVIHRDERVVDIRPVARARRHDRIGGNGLQPLDVGFPEAVEIGGARHGRAQLIGRDGCADRDRFLLAGGARAGNLYVHHFRLAYGHVDAGCAAQQIQMTALEDIEIVLLDCVGVVDRRRAWLGGDFPPDGFTEGIDAAGLVGSERDGRR